MSDHLLARRLLARSPAQGEVDTIHLTAAGAADLVLGVELHDAAGKFGVIAGLDLEAETEAAEPVDARRLPVGEKMQLAGLRVSAFAENVANRTGDALANFAARES